MSENVKAVGGVAQSRYTQCDHCGEVDNVCGMEEWEDATTGETHTVHFGEVDGYLAALREETPDRGRLSDGTRII